MPDEAPKLDVEVTRNALVDTRPGGTPPAAGTPEAQKAAKIAETRKILAKNDAEAALEAWHLDIEDDDKYIAQVEDRIHASQRTADGKKDWQGAEQTRRTESTTNIQLVNKFLREGSSNLTPAELTDVMNKVSPALATMWPEAAAYFAANTPERDAFIRDMLTNPKYRERVQKLLKERAGSQVAPEAKVDRALEQRKREAEKAITDTQREKDRVDAELNEVTKRRKDEFGTSRTPGTKTAELNRLRGEQAQLVADRDRAQAQVTQLTNRLTALQQEAAAARGESTVVTRGGTTTNPAIGREVGLIAADIAAVQASLTAPEQELARTKGELSKLTQLEEDQRQLKEREQELKDRQLELADDLNFKTGTLTEVKGELNDQLRVRQAWEQEYVRDLQNILSDAAQEQISERVEQANEAQIKMLEMKLESTQDPTEQRLLRSIKNNRWDEKRTTGIFNRKREITVYNKEQISRDFGLLMSEGPEGVIRQMMSDNGTPQAEITAKMGDPEFIAKMQPQVVEQLLTRRLQTGRLSTNDTRIIAESDWGQEAIDKALSNKERISELERRLQNEGVMKSGLYDFFSTKGRKSGIALMILLALSSGLFIPTKMLKEAIEQKS